MSQAVMEKAAELGNLITQTEEFFEVKRKQEAMFKDPVALELLKQYDELKKKNNQKQDNGEELTSEDIKAMEQAELKLSENPKIKAFFEAQSKFQQMLNSAMELIIKPCRS